MTPQGGTIAPDPARTRNFDPYNKVNMPVVAQYRGGTESTGWQPSEEDASKRAELLRFEDFVINPWFIPNDDWAAVMQAAILVFRILVGPKRLRDEDLSPATFYALVDKFTGNGLSYPLVRVRDHL
jgi:hypothetical protein